jgi:hypothetical protein
VTRNRHNKVVKVLFELSKNYKSYRKVYAHHISQNYKPLQILSSQKRGEAEVYAYNPDLWCKWKNNKIDIYEVWDNQTEDACVGDIVLAALTQDVYMIYIVCFSKRQYNLARKLVRVLLSSLFDEEGNALLDPSEVTKYLTLIPDEAMKDDGKLRKFLHDKLKF